MKLDFIPFPPVYLPTLSKSLRAFGLGYAMLLLIITAKVLLRKGHVAQLGGLTWRRNQFCRGWLITGDTGSGKTSSGINQLAHQVFQNEDKWGGLCIDEKGVYWETLSAMAKHYERETDLIHLQIRADGQAGQSLHRFNLTGDRIIPFTTYAKFVVDTATSLGQGGDKGFFKNQAQTHIAYALELLAELQRPVTLSGALDVLSSKPKLDEELEFLNKLPLQTPRRYALNFHFKHRFLDQHRFDGARPFARGLAYSFASLPDFVSKRRQKHLKIPNGDRASHNAAVKGCVFWIRIYSCLEPTGHYVQL